MTASEPPAKWGADSRVDDDVVCRVEEGRDAGGFLRTLKKIGSRVRKKKLTDINKGLDVGRPGSEWPIMMIYYLLTCHHTVSSKVCARSWT